MLLCVVVEWCFVQFGVLVANLQFLCMCLVVAAARGLLTVLARDSSQRQGWTVTVFDVTESCSVLVSQGPYLL